MALAFIVLLQQYGVGQVDGGFADLPSAALLQRAVPTIGAGIGTARKACMILVGKVKAKRQAWLIIDQSDRNLLEYKGLIPQLCR